MSDKLIGKKFEAAFLTQAVEQGGTLLSAYKEMKRLKDVNEAYYPNLGLVKYQDMLDSLSSNDLELLVQVKEEYNMPKLNEVW